MPSEKRQRQDEARLNKRVAQQSASKRQQRTRGARNVAIIVVGLAIAAGAYSLIWGGSDKKSNVTAASTSTSVSTSTTEATVNLTYPGPGAAVTGVTPCPSADGSAKRTTTFAAAPPTCIKTGKTYQALVATSEGDITVDLDSAKAPIAVNNFVVLARYHYYDGVPFHRIVQGFVDQAGSPIAVPGPGADQNGVEVKAFLATPGYTLKDELPDATGLASPADAYPDGTFAMANRGANTSSNEWFIVVNGGGAQFKSNPNYTVFGHISKGLDVATKINALGDANQAPTKLVTVTSVTITES